MHKNLCLSCAMDLAKRVDIRSLGKPAHLGMCSACGDKMLVTAYYVPDISSMKAGAEAKPTEAPTVPAAKSEDDPLRQKITVEVDVRTANKILYFSRLWGKEQGRVVDSLMTTFLKRGRELRGQ